MRDLKLIKIDVRKDLKLQMLHCHPHKYFILIQLNPKIVISVFISKVYLNRVQIYGNGMQK